jgi:hypothetical protein
MDFKSLISKIESIDGKIDTPKAPELPKSVQLNEDAQLRVLSGRTTYVAEAKKKAEEDVKEEMKVGDKKASATGGTIEKTATGIKHHAGKNYGGSKAEVDNDDEDDKPKKKAKKESVEPEFKSKFMKMVEAKKEEADKKKKMTKKEKMAEGSKPDFLDVDKDGDKKEPMKKAAAEKGGEKKDSKKGMSDKQAKYFGKKNESVSSDVKKASKKLVKESAEPKMSFKQMVQLVQESGGQQQIDAVDKALFTWAERVAKNKLGEGMKADLYAGLVYERNGGVFEMYDVLSEDQK